MIFLSNREAVGHQNLTTEVFDHGDFNEALLIIVSSAQHDEFYARVLKKSQILQLSIFQYVEPKYGQDKALQSPY